MGYRVLPLLTPLAAVGLAVIMVGAVVKTMRHDSVAFPVATLVACLVVIVGRVSNACRPRKKVA